MLNNIKKNILLIFFFFSILLLLNNSCVEEFVVEEIEIFDNALVIEASITNELKEQKIMLTRAFQFGEEGNIPENDANVSIVDDMGNIISFSETESGIYTSTQDFQAQAERNYNLLITTVDGRKYASEVVRLTQATPIENVSAERIINDREQEGMAILVNTFDPSNNSNFYRYEYEETFLVIAPDWVETDLIAPMRDLGGPDDCSVEFAVRDPNEQVCYGTNESNEIILTNTMGLAEDRVSNFIVRFVNRDDYILTHRYSILVRQFVQSAAAHTFFDTLLNLSESEDVFSQLQPGLLVGNVFSEDNDSEIVLGYFDLTTVSEQRIFFNYDDFFPGERLPPYVVPCIRSSPPIVRPFSQTCQLSTFVASNSVKYLGPNLNPQTNDLFNAGGGAAIVVPRVCGDCTAVGSSITPSFWVE